MLHANYAEDIMTPYWHIILDILLPLFGIALAIAGIVLAYYSVTSARVAQFLVRRGMRRLPRHFVEIAQEYHEADRIPDNSTDPIQLPFYDTRVRRKDVLSARLGGLAFGNQIERAVLAEAAEDGFLVALAEVIILEPRRDDIRLIQVATQNQVPPHTDYRMLEAIKTIAKSGLLEIGDRKYALTAIANIESRLGRNHLEAVVKIRDVVQGATIATA